MTEYAMRDDGIFARVGQELRGTLTLVLIVINTIFWAIPIYVGIVLKLIVPLRAWRDGWQRLLAWFKKNGVA